MVANTQTVVGALKSAGFTFSTVTTVRASRPHPRGEIVTISKQQTEGVSVSKSRMGVLVDFYGSDRDARLATAVAALVARGFNVSPPKPGMIAVVK